MFSQQLCNTIRKSETASIPPPLPLTPRRLTSVFLPKYFLRYLRDEFLIFFFFFSIRPKWNEQRRENGNSFDSHFYFCYFLQNIPTSPPPPSKVGFQWLQKQNGRACTSTSSTYAILRVRFDFSNFELTSAKKYLRGEEVNNKKKKKHRTLVELPRIFS